MSLPEIGSDNDRFLVDQFRELIKGLSEPIVIVIDQRPETEELEAEYETRVYYKSPKTGKMAVFQAKSPEFGTSLGTAYGHVKEIFDQHQPFRRNGNGPVA